MFIKLLNFNIFKEDKKSLMKYIDKLDKVNIVSGNPEVLFNGLNDQRLEKSFKNDKSIIIPDGVGTVIASKLIKNPVKEKIAGIDVVKEVLKKSNDERKSIYFLGAQEEIIVKCIENIKKQFPSLNVAGYHNGFFDLNNCDQIIEEIKRLSPYAVLVAMGSPRQDIFIDKILNVVDSKIFMGVGGVFDVFAGQVNRAPKWMISIGLEWLYRVYKEPFRIKRLSSIPKFLLLVLKNRK